MMSETPNLESIVSRLNDLQQENARISAQVRSLKVVGLISLVLAILIGMMGAVTNQQQLTQARRFEVVDEQGNVRGVFGMKEQGDWAVLELHDRNGKTRVALRAGNSGTSNLYVIGHKGGRMIVTCGKQSNMYLLNEETQAGVNASVSDGDPHFSLFKGDGDIIFEKP